MSPDIPPHIAANIERMAERAARAVWDRMTPWQKLRAIVRSWFR